MTRKLLALAASFTALFVVFALLQRSPWSPGIPAAPARAQQTSLPTGPRIYVPYTTDKDRIPVPTRAVFWFGSVTPSTNYADVRVIFNDDALFVTLHVFDRLLWSETSPAPDDHTNWDAATLYLKLDGNTGDAPTPHSYRFVAQLGASPSNTAYQAAYQGNGATWQAATTTFEAETFIRGSGINNGAAVRGWVVNYQIPFSSLGLTERPADGTTWGVALALHDRDDQNTPPLPTQWWPDEAEMEQPATWAQLVFGTPTYTPPVATASQSVTIRHGLNGAVVPDAHVGGDTNCGERYAPTYFDGWGDANYQGSHQINIQNQWDVADWPCFSKYYVTFPLDTLPPAKPDVSGTVLSATLTLYQFGNANPSQAVASQIQVMTVADDWDEATLTWNNGPRVVENVAATRVPPLDAFPGWPGVPRVWDVSSAVAQAYAAGEPLRLVLYAADGAYHSGKYFSSSDVEEWNAVARPTLRVLWGNAPPPTPEGGYDVSRYLPLLQRSPS